MLGLEPMAEAAGRWLAGIEQGGSVRVTDPVLLRHLLWTGVERGLPVQVHTGHRRLRIVTG